MAQGTRTFGWLGIGEETGREIAPIGGSAQAKPSATTADSRTTAKFVAGLVVPQFTDTFARTAARQKPRRG